MFIKNLFAGTVAAACLGMIGPGCRYVPAPEAGVPLDQADCTLHVFENAAASTATTAAVITTRIGLPVRLRDDQAVLVNGEPLVPTDSDGRYAATIPLADTYTVTVSEPTRGVQDTPLAAPPDFAVTAPTAGAAASLSGFTVTWTNADPDLQVMIALSQTLFDQERRLVVGPFADAGGRSFGAADLSEFRQGADLFINVTKISRRASIGGFDSGDYSVWRSRSVAVAPAP